MMNYHNQKPSNSKGPQPSLTDFSFVSKIGEGSYSSVHKVIKKSDGKFYALKKVRLDSLKPKEKENALNEVRILASINHPHIISYKDTFFDEKSNSLCLVMEYAEEGDLQRRVDKNAKSRQHFQEQDIWKVFIHCLRGLQVLHGMKILHRDIKCANIFISKEGNYKLGDLNVSKVAKKGLVYTQTGTPYYASPEVWRDEPYDFKSDIWSLGCIIYELCALKPPFRAKNMEGLFQRVQKGVFDRIPRVFSDDLFNVISLCLKVNSSLRPTCKQLINNSILKKRTQQFQQEPSHQEFQTIEIQNNFNLLNTIKVPKNMRQLAQNLPKSKYEDVQNASFDNADLLSLDKQTDKLKRSNKVSSALPNYNDSKRRADRVKSENPRYIENNYQLQQNKENINLPNIYESSSNPKHLINEKNYDNSINSSLPKLNPSGLHNNSKNNNNKRSPYEYYNNQNYSKKNNNNNYHYVDALDYSQNSQKSISLSKKGIERGNLETQLANKERLLMGKQKYSGNDKSEDLVNNKSPYYSQNKKNKYLQQQQKENSLNQYQQIQQQILQQQQYNEKNYSNIAHNVDNNNSRQYMPSPISHNKKKNYMPFNPITQQQSQNINGSNTNRPAWWG